MKLLLALMLSLSPAAVAASDTSEYFFNRFTIGYFDHFDYEGHTTNFFLSFPLIRYRFAMCDPYFSFGGNELKEMGFDFPIVFTSRFIIVPSVFKNIEHEQTGFKIICTFPLR